MKRARKQFPRGSAVFPKAGLWSLSAIAIQVLRQRVMGAWSLMWMRGQFPENAERFATDVDKLIRSAVEYANRGKPLAPSLCSMKLRERSAFPRGNG